LPTDGKIRALSAHKIEETMQGLTRRSPTISDNIRYGMPREVHNGLNPSQRDGYADFLGGLSVEERKYFEKHGHLAGFKEE
jgi:hypothetical protein